MPDDGGRHTRIVRWLKVALPLAALALLSTLFLVSNRIGGDIDLPYSEGEIEDRDFVGLWATSVQHQIDHLNGRLYVDHLSPLRRKMIVAKSDKLRRIG